MYRHFACKVKQKKTICQHNLQQQQQKQQWKLLLDILHFKAGAHLIVCEHIMGSPVCVPSFVPPVPSSAVAVRCRRSGFFLCGLQPNQNAW